MAKKNHALVPIPGPSVWPLLGNLFDIDTEHGLASVLEMGRSYGDIFQLVLGGNKLVFLQTHALFDEVCDESRFCKVVVSGLGNLRAGVNDGLFTAHDGEHNWGVAHRIIMPIFGPIKIRETLGGMKDVCQELSLKWARYGPDHRIDIAGDLTRLTLDTIALCTMGYRFNSFYRNSDVHPFVKSMVGFLREADKSSMMPEYLNAFRWKARRSFLGDIASMREMSMMILNLRRGNPSDRDDLLNALLHGRDPKTGEGMSDESIINNLITFLVAGHETTSGALSFVFYYLLTNPESLKSAREEVDRVIGAGNITADHLSKLPYIDAVLREALRLNPTGPAITLGAREDTTLGGKYAVKKGDPVLCMFHNIHRDKKVYGEDADEWKPKRMLDENFNKLPKNAWKPFGNGTRGCIGRAFAWQESQLVIASILQNFDLTLDNPDYKLEIVETLTIKPANFYVRAKLRSGRTPRELCGFSNPISTNIQIKNGTIAPANDGQVGNSTPVTILYGSNSGTCEALAHRLARDAPSYGYSVTTVATLDSVIGILPRAKYELVVIITCSYDGLPADNAVRFCNWLKTLDEDALGGMPFAVFACGHHDWAKTFYKVPIMIDELLAQAGAHRVAQMGKANSAVSDMFSDLENWEDEHLWSSSSAAGNETVDNVARTEVKQDITITNPRARALHHNAVECIVSETHKLSESGSALKYHVEIQLPANMKYAPGDHLSVLPINPRQNVRRALARFHLAGDSVLSVARISHMGTIGQETLSAFDVFASYVELSQPATRRNIATLVSVTPEGEGRNELAELGGAAFESQIRDMRVSVLDLLERYKAIKLCVGAFIDMLPPLRVRTYSISSSALWKPSHASLTISVLAQPALSGQGSFLGVASNFLADLVPGDAVHFTIRPCKKQFHLPDDASAHPIIMVAAGSGIAPFRGFIQDRALQRRNGVQLQPAILFFGCRGSEQDDLYRQELDEFEAEGVVSVRRAFSGEETVSISESRMYVQDRMWADRAEVIQLWNLGAKIYVCGGINMADGVREIFNEIVDPTEVDGKRGAESLNKLSEETMSARYVAEIFSQT